jgi:hypothetical protein
VEIVFLLSVFVVLAIGAGIAIAILVKGSRTKRIASGVASGIAAWLVLYLAAFPVVGPWLFGQLIGK